MRPTLSRRSLPAILSAVALGAPRAGALASEASPARMAGVPVPPGQVEAAIGRLDDLAAALLRRTGQPGLAVAVVRDGALAYARGFGLRRAGAGAMVDADTVFQLASLSKPIGACVVAHQVGAGTIRWDTPLARHLPWFALNDPWVSRHVSVADLYAHRSGLPSHAGDDLEAVGFDRREILERLRLVPLGPFRAQYAYTNFGLTAAAEAVAAAAGTDWETLSQATLYRPLGMAATSSRHADFVRSANRADLHVSTAGGFRPLFQRQPDAQSPAGGVSASVRDVATWMAMVLAGGRHDGRALIAPEALLPAITPQVVSGHPGEADARAGFYGYGFGTGTEASGRVALSHSGAFSLGAATTFLMLPSLGLGIAVLANARPDGSVEALARDFADLVQFGRITRDWPAAFAALMAPMMAPSGRLVGQPRPAAPPPPAPGRYAGRYTSAYFGEVVVSQAQGALALTLARSGQRYVLEPWAADVFTLSALGEIATEGSISAVSFDIATGNSASAVTIEFLDADGLGTFRR